MLITYIILQAQKRIGNERSVAGLFYILKGKPSIQTIQDAQLFGLDSYFGIYKHLSKQRFLSIIKELNNEGYLICEDPAYELSDKGQAWLNSHKSLKEELFLNGKKYHKIDITFFSRLQLLIQVWTNAKKNNRTYIPIIEEKETVNWVKNLFTLTRNKLDTYLYHLHEELFLLFTPLPPYFPEIILSQLSAYKHIGKTTEQLALEHDVYYEEIHIRTINVIHYLLHHVQIKKEEYPILYLVMKQLDNIDNITASAQSTKFLINKGLTPDEIALRRSLKVNTIYDHIVELALYDYAFPFEQYIGVDMYHKIKQTTLEYDTFKLSTLKEVLGEDVSYFQIRLALTMLSHNPMMEEMGTIHK